MFVRIRMIALCVGLLASAILAAEGRVYAAVEPLPEANHGPVGVFTATPPENPVPAENRDAPSQPTALPPEFAPAAPLTIETAAEPLDSPETLDFDVPIIRTAKVDKHVQFFSSHIRDRFEIWLGRLERHRPMVERIFTEFNLDRKSTRLNSSH